MFSREELIDRCERSIVPIEHWYNRDSDSAQRGVGTLWALLKAGCNFVVLTHETPRHPNNAWAVRTHSCYTDDKTIWVEVQTESFMHVELGENVQQDYLTFYLPTDKRLEEANGGDWY